MKPLSQTRVLVTPTSFGKFNQSLKDELEKSVGEVIYNDTGKPLSSKTLTGLLRDIDGYIAGLDEIDAGAICNSNCLKVISRYGVGVSNVDLEAAKQKGLIVTNTPGANSVSVAELTVCLILNLIRHVIFASIETREGNWPRTKGLSLDGKKVGVFGLGAIGKEVAKRLSNFDCQLMVYDLVEDREFVKKYGVEFVSQDEIISQSDVLSLHVPVTDTTCTLVDSGFLSRMKPEAYLVNTSRGELVDEDALYSALEGGKLAGAALDAFQNEPPGKNHLLASHPKVIATPHMGAHTDGATNAMGEMSLRDCLAVLKGQEPKYRVV